MNIELRNVHKRFSLPDQKSLEILKSCHLKVRKGEKVIIVGPSGVGKSTLLHIIGLMEPLSAGEMYWDGQRVDAANSGKLALWRNQRIGFVFQYHHLLNECTALENVMIPAMIAGARQGQLQKRASELLMLMELQDRMDFFPRQLSGGERQRIALARALMNHPDLILADEVTGNLDPSLKDAMMKLLIDSCNVFQATLIAVTHDYSLLQYYDTVYKLEDGHLHGPVQGY